MSCLEVLAIVGCIAAALDAFNNGYATVKSSKAKKAAILSKSLEESLERDSPAVEDEKKQGLD